MELSGISWKGNETLVSLRFESVLLWVCIDTEVRLWFSIGVIANGNAFGCVKIWIFIYATAYENEGGYNMTKSVMSYSTPPYTMGRARPIFSRRTRISESSRSFGFLCAFWACSMIPQGENYKECYRYLSVCSSWSVTTYSDVDNSLIYSLYSGLGWHLEWYISLNRLSRLDDS